MSKIFDKLKIMDTFTLFDNTVAKYQRLSLSEKLDFLDECKKHKITISLGEVHEIQFKIAQFFLNEFLTHSVKDFNQSKIHNELIKYALFFSLPNEEDNFQSKKTILDLLLKKDNFQVNKSIDGFNLLNLMARHNDLNTLKYLVSLGAKTNVLDKKEFTFASATINEHENVEAFTYAINQPNFNPNVGENVLALSISKKYEKAIEAIIYSPNHLLSNEEFVNFAKKSAGQYIEEKVMPIYEKFLLESKCDDSKHEVNKKIKI
jgi:hypothetical protein